MKPSPIDIAASQNPAHPNFHISFGQVLASAMLGLAVYSAQDHAIGGTSAFFEDPRNLSSIVSGFTAIWVQPATPLAGQ